MNRILLLLGGIQLGSLYVRYSWLGAFAGLVAGYLVIPYVMRADQLGAATVKTAQDRHVRAFVLFLALWKWFAPIVDLHATLVSPLLLLFSAPTHTGLWVGLATAVGYLALANWKKPVFSAAAALDVYGVATAAAAGLAAPFWLVLGRPLPFSVFTAASGGNHFAVSNLYAAVALAPFLLRAAILLRRRLKTPASPSIPPVGAAGAEALFGLATATLIASLTVTQGSVAFALSPIQWGAAALGLTSAGIARALTRSHP